MATLLCITLQDLIITRLSCLLTPYSISPTPTLETNLVSFYVCGVSWIPHEITVFVSDLPHTM